MSPLVWMLIAGWSFARAVSLAVKRDDIALFAFVIGCFSLWMALA